MSAFLFLIVFLLLSFILIRLTSVKQNPFRKSFVIAAFIVKIAAGSGFTLLYTYYYTERGAADVYKFFDDAQVIASTLPEHPEYYFRFMSGWDEQNPALVPYRKKMRNWEPQSSEWLAFTQTQSYNFFTSNRIITRINALLLPISQGNIFIHVLFFSFLITLASFAFIHSLRNSFSDLSATSLIFLLFWPSVLLWCSAPMKDTLTLASVFFTWAAFSKIIHQSGKLRSLLSFVFWISVLVITKYYVLPALLAAFLIYSIRVFSPAGKASLNFIRILIPAFGLMLMFEVFAQNHGLIDMLNNKREEALKAAIFGEANQMAFVHLVDGGMTGFTGEVPFAIVRALCLPLFPLDFSNIMLLAAGLENAFLLLFLAIGVVQFRKNEELPAFTFACIIYTLILALIIGYTTPVYGGIVRYKTAFLPLILIALNPKFNWLEKKFKAFIFSDSYLKDHQ